ncbi:hypothetical protein [Actinomadura madurae]|uniref:hypothetical protein n=1 Tax=Actinomadura madurae TaxID=1993 RepID=UPI0020D20518|nr:hypothetical protein [Actinomadura madurae]MCQ0021243.1 hypothetical protein [Actinomadura madurae]
MRRTLTARKTKIAVFNRVLSRLPVKTGLAVFESHLGGTTRTIPSTSTGSCADPVAR